jgi:hypothetical protein
MSKEEQTLLGAFENRTVRKKIGHKREEVAEHWRRL